MDAPKDDRRSRLWRAARWLALMLACLLAVAWAQRPDGRLHVYFLDTPGDAVLVQAPSGRFALIDGGGDPALMATTLGRLMPFWRRDMAAVALTRADGAHLPGQVAALARYRPDLVLGPPGMPAGGVAGEWLRLVGAQGAPLRALRPGARIGLGGGATLSVLGVSAGEGGGAVLLVEYGAARVLIHGGGPDGDAAAMAAAGKPLAAIAYPWQREFDTPLLAALRPRAVAFTSAYEAAEPALLSYAERRLVSPALYHEKNDGTVELISDGRSVWFATQR
ncbi:hypothetical protein [Oscillochloris sp. ZM17-4]|uniref:hypothetical protein n=1 Tax=Oscillochloris sp. ZM17-4 TaxID=2866714 RepID=UPI002105752A|nr:hypothetical protein [Oscillochloris sp. ZM17-4]